MQLLPLIILVYSLSIVSALQWCERDMYETAFHTRSEELEVLVIWFPVRAGSQSVLQLCSNYTGQPIERQCSYNSQATNATWDTIEKQTTLLNCSQIYNNCMREPFEHYYLMKNKVTQDHTNMWPPASLGELAKPQEPCLLETGLPLTRKCLYNAHDSMAEWEEKDFHNIKCLRDINQDIVTYDLNNLYQDVRRNHATFDEDSLGAAANLTNLLAKAQTIRIAADLEIATNILEILTLNNMEPQLVQKVLEVTNLLMQSDDSVVRSSNKLGTPNTLIKTVEAYLDGMANIMMPTSKCNVVRDGVIRKSEQFLSVFYINPMCSNVSGIGVYSTTAHRTPSMIYDSHTDTYYRYLYLNQSLEEIMNEPHVEAASYLPKTLWTTLLNETSDKLNVEALRFTLYNKRNFFVDHADNGRSPDSIVLKFSIPDYRGDLPGDIPLIFKHHQSNEKDKPQCATWDYHTWRSTGPATANAQNLVLCKTRRTTSFGALVGLSYERRLIADSVMLTTIMELTMDIISIVGCGLSLFGLMCIWVMAMCCKQWRSQSSNKLLLNMCLVLTLIMAYFLFINMPDLRNALVDVRNLRHCIAEGAFLQYTILVLFLWMLFLAILQYQRYVTVLGVERPRHFIAKYALAAWGLPLIPTALVIIFNSTSYMPLSKEAKDANAICYPSGSSFYFALLLPISIIITANVGIFVYILCSVRRSMRKFKRTQERKDVIVQLRLSILLFFLLGISWVFGILAHMDESRVLSVLFCLTATLQGFVLFVYFVIIDKSVRYSWLKCCCAKAYYTLEDTTMSPMTSLNS